MDLDKALVSSILKEGKVALDKAGQMGVTSARLNGEGRAAFEFVQEYFRKNGAMPVVQQILGKTGIVIDDDDIFALEDVPDRSANFFIEEVNNRHLHGKIQEGLGKIIAKQTERKPIEAYQTLENLAAELRSEQIGMSNVQPLWKLGPDVQTYYDKIKRGERGVLTPWPSLNDATMGFWPEDLVLFAARLGSGKCVHHLTSIPDPVTGVPRTIEDLFENSEDREVVSWSKAEGVHSRGITAKHDTGTKRCLRVTFGTGRSIIVTPEHPFLTPDGWRRADEIGVGWTCGLPARMPHPKEPESLQDHEVDFLALMLADGACTASDIRFSKTDLSIVGVGRSAAAAMGLELVSSNGGADWRFTTRATGNQPLHPGRRLLDTHGLAGKLSKEKVIPDAVYRLPAKQLARFLSVFFMCDGYIEHGVPGVTLASEKLVRQIQSLLLRFGVQSRVEYKKAKNQDGEFDSWRLRVYSQFTAAFAAQIPMWGEKGELFQAYLNNGKKRNPNVGFPRVTATTKNRLKALSGSVGFRNPNSGKLKEVAARLGRKTFTAKDAFHAFGDLHAVQTETMKAFSGVFGFESEVSWWWDSDLFWDVIESVEDAGEQKIYDLTVAPTSCFVANDVIVHNTWTAVQLALHAWANPKPQSGARQKVLFITTEVSQLRIAMRFLAAHEKLPYGEFTHGKLSFVNEYKLKEAIDRYFNDEYLHIIGGDFDFQIESVASAIDTVRPDLVILDGVYLLRVPGANRNERMANAFDECKRLAKRKKVPLVIFTQFNREVKKDIAKTVQVESIALSDVGGWNSDLIVGLVQTDEMKQAKQMILKPLKVREGEGKEIMVNWDFERMNFSEINSVGGGGGDADEKGTSLEAPDAADDDDLPF